MFCFRFYPIFISFVACQLSYGSNEKHPVLDLNSILFVTYENNLEIASARYDLIGAEIDFEEFEKELSQFTPLVLDSDYEHDRDRIGRGSVRRVLREDDYVTRVGMEKSFFNGSKVSLGTGYRETDRQVTDQSHGFAEFDAKFPFLGSATKLRRVTSRTFEENEMFNNRLDFVETLRDKMSDAYGRYFWLQFFLERRSVMEDAIVYLNDFLNSDIGRLDDAGVMQVKDEIQSMNARLSGVQERIDRRLIDLQDEVGINIQSLEQVKRIDMYADDFYGRHYLEKSQKELYNESYANDADIRVLRKALENEELKKKLAVKGKWDVFGKVFGEYEFGGRGSRKEQTEYVVGVGVSVKKLDPSLLRLSLRKAESQIKKFQAKIDRRQQELSNDIARSHGTISSLYQQVQEMKSSVDSRKEVFDQKENSFRNGTETLDVFLDSRNKYVNTQLKLVYSIAELFSEIADLDETTGVYFERLGLTIEGATEEQQS